MCIYYIHKTHNKHLPKTSYHESILRLAQITSGRTSSQNSESYHPKTVLIRIRVLMRTYTTNSQ
jgi:hypothetical protein